jgi:hypothetical protein
LIASSNKSTAGLFQSRFVAVSSGRLKFNFLSYESITSGADLEENIVNVMIEVARITNPQGKGGENEEFWQSQRKKLLRNIVGLLLPVDGSVDLLRMNAILNSASRIQPRRGRRIGAIPRRFSKRSPEPDRSLAQKFANTSTA